MGYSAQTVRHSPLRALLRPAELAAAAVLGSFTALLWGLGEVRQGRSGAPSFVWCRAGETTLQSLSHTAEPSLASEHRPFPALSPRHTPPPCLGSICHIFMCSEPAFLIDGGLHEGGHHTCLML